MGVVQSVVGTEGGWHACCVTWGTPQISAKGTLLLGADQGETGELSWQLGTEGQPHWTVRGGAVVFALAAPL